MKRLTTDKSSGVGVLLESSYLYDKYYMKTVNKYSGKYHV